LVDQLEVCSCTHHPMVLCSVFYRKRKCSVMIIYKLLYFLFSLLMKNYSVTYLNKFLIQYLQFVSLELFDWNFYGCIWFFEIWLYSWAIPESNHPVAGSMWNLWILFCRILRWVLIVCHPLFTGKMCRGI